MKSFFYLLLLLSVTSASAQPKRSIAGLVWSTNDSVKTGIKKFFVDSLTTAHVQYIDNDKTKHNIELDLESTANNVYVFKHTDKSHTFWLFVGDVDSPEIKVSFEKAVTKKDMPKYTLLKGWKMLTTKNGDKGLNNGATPDINLFENVVLSFKNISCCTNHKVRHCARTTSEMAEFSKNNHCVF